MKTLGLVEGEPKKISVNGKDAWLLFPAKLYCGQSLFDSRRESIIIDYFFTDEIPGYQEKPDFLAGGAGCACATRSAWCARASISAARISIVCSALNFTLYNKAIAEKDGPAFVQTGQVKEDCWAGTQARAYANEVRSRRRPPAMKTRRNSTAPIFTALLLAPAWTGMNATSHALEPAGRPAAVVPAVAADIDRPGGAHWVVDPALAGDDLPSGAVRCSISS